MISNAEIDHKVKENRNEPKASAYQPCTTGILKTKKGDLIPYARIVIIKEQRVFCVIVHRNLRTYFIEMLAKQPQG